MLFYGTDDGISERFQTCRALCFYRHDSMHEHASFAIAITRETLICGYCDPK